MMGIDVLALQQRHKKKFNGDRYETDPEVNFFSLTALSCIRPEIFGTFGTIVAGLKQSPVAVFRHRRRPGGYRSSADGSHGYSDRDSLQG